MEAVRIKYLVAFKVGLPPHPRLSTRNLLLSYSVAIEQLLKLETHKLYAAHTTSVIGFGSIFDSTDLHSNRL